MSDGAKKFVWYELMTTDMKAAEAFYRDVIGWEMKDSGMPGMAYTLLWKGPTMVGGLMAIPEDAQGAQPGWLGYVGVEDVDAYAVRVTGAGGVVHRAAQDIPGIGRFAVVADPHGATFVLFQGNSAPPPEQEAAGASGRFGWHELHSGELEAGFAFYSGLFGWTKTEALDMGPMGVYQMFATGGTVAVGGMMTKMAQMPAPFWLYYINVDGADAAVERVKAAGGQVVMGPHQVPGGNWIVQAMDPQGGTFAMVSLAR